MSSDRLDQRRAEAQLDRMLTEYHDTLPFFSYRIPLNNKDPLRDAIAASPELKARLVEAVASGYLTKFSNEAAEAGAAAEYSATERKIVIPAKALANRAELVFTLGHENAHALSTRGINFREEVTKPAIESIARGAEPRDYTRPIKELVDRTVAEEAQAHIGGFNAVVSALGRQGVEPTPKNLYQYNPGRMRDFIEIQGAHPDTTYAMKPGLTRGDDGMLLRNDQNIDAMKAYYPEKIPGSFGDNGLLNYRHQAVMDGWTMAHASEQLALAGATSHALSEWEREQDAQFKAALNSSKQGGLPDTIMIDGMALTGVSVPDFQEPDPAKILRDANAERRQYTIDFDQLGLHPALLDPSKASRDGTVTVNNPALGGRDDFPGKVVVGAREGAAILEREAQALRPPVRDAQPSASVSASSTQSPDAMQSQLYLQAIAGVRGMKLEGVNDRAQMLNVAASLALEAHKAGLTSIDHVVKGEKGNLFAVQGPDARTLGAPRAGVDVAAAAKQPSEDSIGRLHASLSEQARQPVDLGQQQQPHRLTQ